MALLLFLTCLRRDQWLKLQITNKARARMEFK